MFFQRIFAFTLPLISICPAYAQTPRNITSSYLVCHNLDLRNNRSVPVVSTLVISPDVNGKRYYTSWVAVSEDKDSTVFTGRGPEELQGARVTEDEIEIEFPESKNPLDARYRYLRARKVEHYFIAFKSVNSGDVSILYPSKNLFGRPVVREFTRNASVECHFLNPSEVLISDAVDLVKVEPDYVQSYHFSDMTHVKQWSRSLQDGLLKKFVDEISSKN